jgi:predicted outer membrane repeat protein
MKILMIVWGLFFVLYLSATIINIPGDQSTVQDGINVAANGDTVLLQPGTYYEHINYNGKNIVVASLFLTTQNEAYISQTIIDGNGILCVAKFEYGEDPTAILCGVTIENGCGYEGGGIYIHSSDPTLLNLVISNNEASYGGGVYCENSNPTLRNVIFSNNYEASSGGGMYCEDSNLNLENVNISYNSSFLYGGGIQFYNSEAILKNVIIKNNSSNYYGGGINLYNSDIILKSVVICNNFANHNGGGISMSRSSPSLVNVTMSNNSTAGYGGGGISCINNSAPNLENCILWNDSPEEIYFIEYVDPSSVSISYSDIEGGLDGIVTNNTGIINWLDGNINADPLFVGTGDHPLMLQDLSSCVNFGVPDTTGLNLPEFDLAGNPRVYGGRIDMGAYENQNVIVSSEEYLIPQATFLYQNFPNPFNPTTTIEFLIQKNSDIDLSIFNIKGQKIKSLTHDKFTKGLYSIIWNGDDESGKPVSSGIYYYKLNVNGKTEAVKKCLLMK